MDNLEDILKYQKQKQVQLIVQKYIENPLLINKKKFDIRQWVLVTSYDPLGIWFYEKNYVRFTAMDYDTSNLKNKYSHLTNNSVSKHSKNYKRNDCFWS